MVKHMTKGILTAAMLTVGFQAAAIGVADIERAYAERADQSLSMAQYIDQYVLNGELPTDVNEAEDVIRYALEQAAGDEELILSILRKSAAAGVPADNLLAASLLAGVDPSLVTSALDTATAAGPLAPAGAAAAPAPGTVGFGGGTGGGSGTISTN